MTNRILFFIAALTLSNGFGLVSKLSYHMDWHGVGLILNFWSWLFLACGVLGLVGKEEWLARFLKRLT